MGKGSQRSVNYAEGAFTGSVHRDILERFLLQSQAAWRTPSQSLSLLGYILHTDFVHLADKIAVSSSFQASKLNTNQTTLSKDYKWNPWKVLIFFFFFECISCICWSNHCSWGFDMNSAQLRSNWSYGYLPTSVFNDVISFFKSIFEFLETFPSPFTLWIPAGSLTYHPRQPQLHSPCPQF